MPTPSTKEPLYIDQLPLNLAAIIHKLKNDYNEASEAGKEATLNELTAWLVREKGNRDFAKNKSN